MSARRYRKERVADAILRVLSQVIRAELRNPEVPVFTTVTDTEVSRDLSYATVYVSIPGTRDEKKRALEALQQAKGFLRSRVAAELRLMHTPELNIKEDTSLDYAMHMEQRIDEVMGRRPVSTKTETASPLSTEAENGESEATP